MVLTWAQAADGLSGSSTLLGALLSGSLIIAITGVYRFAVNFRNTERGMARRRIQDANRNERAAQYEASLWQDRCGHLQFLLREAGIEVPPLPPALEALVLADAGRPVTFPSDDPEQKKTGGSPAS